MKDTERADLAERLANVPISLEDWVNGLGQPLDTYDSIAIKHLIRNIRSITDSSVRFILPKRYKIVMSEPVIYERIRGGNEGL